MQSNENERRREPAKRRKSTPSNESARARQRYRLPSLVSYLLNVSILYSASRQAESRRLCDLYLNPPLLKIGLLQWHQFDTIVRQGEQHAREVLEQALGAGAGELGLFGLDCWKTTLH